MYEGKKTIMKYFDFLDSELEMRWKEIKRMKIDIERHRVEVSSEDDHLGSRSDKRSIRGNREKDERSYISCG